MTNQQFSFTSFSDFGSPEQAVTELVGSPDNMSAASVMPYTASAAQHSDIDTTAMEAWQQYEHLKKYDVQKNALIEELIQRYNYLSQKNAELHQLLKLEKEKVNHHSFFSGDLSYKDEYESLKSSVEHDPYVLVLLDGSGMVFHEHYLSRGEEGGRAAAEMLRSSTEVYAREQVPDLPNDVKILARMYANVKWLAEMCCRAGIVSSPSLVEEFVRGFTRGNALFDFVDVGHDSNQPDEKMSAMFKLHAYDARCKHIVFGCSHDAGFAHLLDKYIFDATITTRVTLLEGQPFAKELLDLPYDRMKFGTIFRSESIVPTFAQTLAVKAAAAVAIRATTHTPTESVSSFEDAAYSKGGAVTTWANRAAAAATVTAPPSPPTEKVTSLALSKDTIPRNRKGQRLDPLNKYDREEVNRVRLLKMCNVHYLRKECPYGSKCTHKHDKEPLKKDLEVLKVVARGACCRNGSSCDDPKCIYGHRCQAPKCNDPNKWPNEKKTCIFGPDCVFPAELHNIDLVPVKTTKV